jgi:hypothetical protein
MENCKEPTSRLSKGIPSPLPCGNKVWKDGYCKRHHPDNQAAIQKAYFERLNKRIHADNLRVAKHVGSDGMREARQEAGLLTFEEARALGAKI